MSNVLIADDGDLLPIANIRRIAERSSKQGYETHATLTDGRERLLTYETTDDVLLATAPVLPASNDHAVIVASDCTRTDRACVGLSIHPVVGWRIFRGEAFPIVPGFDVAKEDHELLIGPHGAMQTVSLDNPHRFESVWAWLGHVLDIFQREIDADRKALA